VVVVEVAVEVAVFVVVLVEVENNVVVIEFIIR
jgi:hypothetical protein